MHLYLIERTDSVDYDEYAGHVIAAPSPASCRRLASELVTGRWCEPPETWLSPDTAKVTQISRAVGGSYYKGVAEIVLSSFHGD